MHNRKALRTNVGLWPSRERADRPVSQRHYCPIKHPRGRTSSSHQHTPNTQLKKKTFKFSPLSWAEINQNSICSARMPTGQVIAHQSRDRWQRLRGETVKPAGCFLSAGEKATVAFIFRLAVAGQPFLIAIGPRRQVNDTTPSCKINGSFKVSGSHIRLLKRPLKMNSNLQWFVLREAFGAQNTIGWMDGRMKMCYRVRRMQLKAASFSLRCNPSRRDESRASFSWLYLCG